MKSIFMERTVAEPVLSVKYQINENSTSVEPKMENAWPVQIVKNSFFQLVSVKVTVWFAMQKTPTEMVHIIKMEALF